jgi:hypothetical protein
MSCMCSSFLMMRLQWHQSDPMIEAMILPYTLLRLFGIQQDIGSSEYLQVKHSLTAQKMKFTIQLFT